MALAIMLISLSSCGRATDALDRITYIYDDSALTFEGNNISPGAKAKSDLRKEMTDICSRNLDYTYKHKQAEMLSLMDVIVSEYDNQYLQGKIVLQGSIASSDGSHIVKTWILRYGTN